MKLAIIGSRTAHNLDIDAEVAALGEPIEAVISGGAKGADSEAAAWARAKGIPVVEYRPDYDRFGRGAPLVRNRQIVDNADFVLAFWDGASKGTRNALDYAEKQGVPYTIVPIGPHDGETLFEP